MYIIDFTLLTVYYSTCKGGDKDDKNGIMETKKNPNNRAVGQHLRIDKVLHQVYKGKPLRGLPFVYLNYNI
ncbi:hypothetical protein LBO01_06140 [Companilactobacillus paralimentarius]|nr:hypothetical protein LBO01_06140 [Companilactobacillus paralimentarius]